MIVGSLRGLEAWRRDGSGKRTISAGPALHPRWLDKGTLIVVHPNNPDDFALGGRIERIALASGERSEIAKLPPFACAGGSDKNDGWMRLNLQGPLDFRIDGSKGWACLTLMDRNLNASSLSLDVRIELNSAKIRRYLTVNEVSCQPPKDVNIGQKPSEVCAFPSKATAPESVPRAFNFQSGDVFQTVGAGMKKVLHIEGYEEGARSSSGHWALLGGDRDGGDYIHRQLVLLDRMTGQVFPIHEKAGAWPPPLTGEGTTAPHIQVPVANTIGVVGETDVRWLGTSEQSEVLVVGSLVIVPGRRSFSVDGAVAR